MFSQPSRKLGWWSALNRGDRPIQVASSTGVGQDKLHSNHSVADICSFSLIRVHSKETAIELSKILCWERYDAEDRQSLYCEVLELLCFQLLDGKPEQHWRTLGFQALWNNIYFELGRDTFRSLDAKSGVIQALSQQFVET